MKTNGEIRRDNLALAVAAAGSAAALGRLSGIDPAYFSQIKKGSRDSKTGTPKEMGDTVARKIELAIHKPVGWMDQDHSHGDKAASSIAENIGPSPSLHAARLIDQIRTADQTGLPPDVFEQLSSLLRLMTRISNSDLMTGED